MIFSYFRHIFKSNVRKHAVRYYLLIPLTVCMAVFLPACGITDDKASSELAVICDNMVDYMLSQDGITCNYNVREPSAYITGEVPATLGSYYSSDDNNNVFLENELASLNNINYPSLSKNDKITYDALYETVRIALEMEKYCFLDEPLSPVSGIQAQLPVLLAEYHIYDPSYIDAYFSILNSIPDYFSQIIKYENDKKDNGMFMSGKQADIIIKQCQDFISVPDENYLIDTFDDRLAELPDLSEEQILEYSAANEDIIKNSLIPAYQNIIIALETLKDNAQEPKGLCAYGESGKEYYSLLFRHNTNCSATPDKAFLLLESTLSTCKKNIAKVAVKDDDILSKLKLPIQEEATPLDIISTLKQRISQTYPDILKDFEITLKPVHSSLENVLSPAMYLTPPIDAATSDCIYVNNASCPKSELYTTLAHEAYPGHLYQTRYYMECSPHPVRLILSFPGYTEGWATYAELDSLNLADIDRHAAIVMRNNKLALLCIYSLIDIGIHYKGWDLTDCTRLLIDNGIKDTGAAEEIYMSVVSEPCLYPKYTMACIEFIKMEQYVRNNTGEDYNAAEFHKTILEAGPVWMENVWKIIKERY